MRIEPNDLEKFRKLHKAEFGQELAQAAASEIAGNLVLLYELLCTRLPCEIAEAKRRAEQEERPASPSPE